MADKPVYDKIMNDIDAGALPGSAYPSDILHTKHLDNPDKLHQIADQSHQEHKEVTGQVPNEDEGYTTYKHQGSYYQPGEDE